MSSRRILVVDDDNYILEFVALFLTEEGYTVDTAHHGREALEVIERQVPDVLLLDMRMPILDGWGVVQELKQQGISVPILVMTAATSAERIAREIGARGWVAKPFGLPELLKAIRSC